MIKGHLQIDLHNHNTGLKDRIEQDNMVTNALSKLIPMFSSGQNPEYTQYDVFPLYKKGLGGLLLFNKALTENANNINFPGGDTHLVGCAGQSVESSSFYGSRNSVESYTTDHSAVTVWDFATNQANGVIRSVALTKSSNMQCVDNMRDTISPFRWRQTYNENIPHYPKVADGRPNYGVPLWYEDNFLYYLIPETDGERVHKAKVYKQYCPVNNLKVCDGINASLIDTTYIDDIEITTDTNCLLFCGSLSNTNYFACWNYNVSSAEKLVYFKRINIQDNVGVSVTYWTLSLTDLVQGTITISEPVTVSVQDVDFVTDVHEICFNVGKLYVPNYARTHIYIVDLADTSSVLDVTIPLSGGRLLYESTATRRSTFKAMPNGGALFMVGYTDTAQQSGYSMRRAMIYPDGHIIVDSRDVWASNGDSYGDSDNSNFFITPDLVGINQWSYGYYTESCFGIWTPNIYLGTICNLSQAVTKTSNTSMKVTYTLTDAS